MKFLLENNLRKLAKWLLFMGHEPVVLEGPVRLSEVLSHRDRVFITTSRRWHDTLTQKGFKVILVPRNSWELQLCSVVRQLGLKPSLVLSLCPYCGKELKPAPEQLIYSRVPPKARDSATDFTYCPRCDHLFWKGLHYERMKAMLESALGRC